MARFWETPMPQAKRPTIPLLKGWKPTQRDLAALKEEGKIEFVGAPRTGDYRLRKPVESDE